MGMGPWVQGLGGGQAFEPVNPVIIRVSYLDWSCLQFPIYNLPGAAVPAAGGSEDSPVPALPGAIRAKPEPT